MDVYIVGGQVLVLPSTLAAQLQSDILSSTLTAQIQADAQLPTAAEHATWEQLFQHSMSKMGWRRLERGERHIALRTPTFTLVQALRDELQERWPYLNSTGALASVVAELMRGSAAAERLRLHTRSAAAVVPSESMQEPEPLGLQLIVVDANATLHVTCVACITDQPLEADWLSQVLQVDLLRADLEVRYFAAQLLETRYQTLREGLIKWLGDRRQTLVQRLAPAEPT